MASLCSHPVLLAFPRATLPSHGDVGVLGTGVHAQEGENVFFVYFNKNASVFMVEYLENINISRCLTPVNV